MSPRPTAKISENCQMTIIMHAVGIILLVWSYIWPNSTYLRTFSFHISNQAKQAYHETSKPWNLFSTFGFDHEALPLLHLFVVKDITVAFILCLYIVTKPGLITLIQHKSISFISIALWSDFPSRFCRLSYKPFRRWPLIRVVKPIVLRRDCMA